MSNSAHKCPRCKIFVLGDYCHICKKSVYDVLPKDFTDLFEKAEKELPDFFNDFFKNN